MLGNVVDLWWQQPQQAQLVELENGTLLVKVTEGSAVVMGSKIDGNTQDPATLEVSAPSGDTTEDGLYQFALFDSLLYATGGSLLVVDGMSAMVTASYINYDKEDRYGNPDCTLIFQFGNNMPVSSLDELKEGVVFTDSYSDGSDMMFAIALSFAQNTGFVGALLAYGSGFTGSDTGCNGEFPAQLLLGGKIRGDTSVFEDESKTMLIHNDLKERAERKMSAKRQIAQ